MEGWDNYRRLRAQKCRVAKEPCGRRFSGEVGAMPDLGDGVILAVGGRSSGFPSNNSPLLA